MHDGELKVVKVCPYIAPEMDHYVYFRNGMINQACLQFMLLVFTAVHSSAQRNDTVPEVKAWEFTLATNLYLLPDEMYFIPVFTADHNHLHLESRYNYEDFQTGSLFGGYTIRAGNAFEFNATPMLGIVFGNTDGIAPGLLLDLNYWKLNLYSESEYLVDFAGREANFVYTWSEFTFAPAEWIWFGLSVQRTKVYQTDLDIQRGLTLGFSRGLVSASGYVFNIDKDDPYGVLAVNLNF
jgi:hypothetical protein